MRKFKVTAKFSTYCTVEILAEDENDAYLKAKQMDGGDFEPHEHGDWEISRVLDIGPALSPEQLAFVEAYGSAVADASKDEVIAFFLMEDDVFINSHSTGTYGSIMDAYCMWNRAIDFAKSIEKTTRPSLSVC